MMPTALRFLIAGAAAALAYFVFCYGFLALGVQPAASGALAYLSAIPVGYLLHHSWTFSGRQPHARALPRYFALQIANLCFSTAVVQATAMLLGTARLTVAALATVLTAGFGFVFSRIWVFQEGEAAVNAQYNVASPDSLAVRIAGYQRQRMYQKFLKAMALPRPGITLLDVGVTSDQSYASSNYLEAWYPHKEQIMACGIDNAAFLETRYPGLRFCHGDATALPFPDQSFDFVHASAVIEHVGSFERQARMLAECARVSRIGIFITTPNRWFPVEFHTVLPLVHWLPRPLTRFCFRLLGHGFFAEETNLNLMTRGDITRCVRLAGMHERFDVSVGSVSLGGWPSNLLISGRIKANA